MAPHYSKLPINVTINGSGGGGSSFTFSSGTGTPSSEVGANGDVYLNATNGDLYQKDNGAWGVIANLRGPAGATGAAGTAGPKGDPGDTGPKGDKGDPGDTGPKGDKGDTGDTGAAGADGFPTEAQWNSLLERVEILEGGE